MDEPFSEFDAGSPGPSSRRSPSPPAGQASWLRRTRDRVSLRLRCAVREPVPVAVLAVQRYLGDSSSSGYSYDVTLWDGAEQDTWLLSPELRHLVQGNRLRCGCSVLVRCCSYRYLEKKLASGLVCIEELEPGQEGPPGEPQPLRTPASPLSGDRRHYLPLWNNEDPYGDMWRRREQGQDGGVDVTKVCSLQKLEMMGLSRVTLPPLLVRVMHKSRLRYFGKAEKRTDYPYQAYFEVADHSGMMSLVLWNSLCPEWYNTLQVGNVVLLHQYSVKKGYVCRTLPTPGNSQVKRLPSLEISLNARDPAPKITVLSESNVKSEWNLPAVKYQFVTRLEFNDLPHNRVCDVIGLVTYVGRSERLRKRDDWEDFWVYRWVQMIDGTSNQPFLLEIFATSQPDIFENICPMSYLVCTQMRVIQEYPDDTTYNAYLTTTNESQVFITGHHKGQPYTSDEKVKNYIKWMKTQNEAEIGQKTSIGGYHPYPPIPSTFSKFLNDRKTEEILITILELKAMVEQLHYREHKRVAVQGIIAACTFVENDSKTEMEQVLCGVSAVADHSVNISKRCAEQLTPLKEAPNLVKRRKRPDSGVGPTVSKPENITGTQQLGQEVNPESWESLHFEDEGAGSCAAESDASDETSCVSLSWENPLWSEVKQNVKEHLYYSKLFPESLTQKYDYKQKEMKDFLIQQYNLHSAKVTSLTRHRPSLTSASTLGHHQLTILGLNQNIAIDVSLPMLENFSVFGKNHLPNRLQPAGSGINYEIQGHQWLSLRGELVEYARTRDRLHVICILDLCHLGESKVEVFLNRVYYPTIDCTD
ncbi:RPA-related protein RADX isoform X1 [Bufo gargarizans]|uniref:RPA-related protein RADX isoform X1 n=1 Tax=Bufo gargarizans TaxID=30331 RepID=UPI001CF5C481|nr:RPA-related protein RADX isoform X1 [Bufo gargarizans]